MTDFFSLSIEEHLKHHGKWATVSKFPLETREQLAIAYTPGVAGVANAIARDPVRAYDLTMKGNSIAIVSDGSRVLGLGNIGPEAALPVMEGKAILFKKFANIDGVPIVLNTHSIEGIIQTILAIAPTFGGINLEDIAVPQCFIIEESLQNIGIPVFHDDQHGTAIAVYAALLNACKVVGKPMTNLKVVLNGAGAAGTAIARMLTGVSSNTSENPSVKNVYMCDTQGIVSRRRTDLQPYKQDLLNFTNPDNQSGTLKDALRGADVFIGVSQANLLKANDIQEMTSTRIIFALSNPTPEISPEEAKAGGAVIIATGRSDYPNQVNNSLAFPGIFRGALDARAVRITDGMKFAAAKALASMVPEPTADCIIPDTLDPTVAQIVAQAVREQAIREGVIRKSSR
ncbi:MAG: NADP-dependent malic enzyme [Planctomycetota bacterium]